MKPRVLQLDAFGPEPFRADGETFDPAKDSARLGRLMAAVFDCMKDGSWWTLRALSDRTGGAEASVSARIRDLRKTRFGGYEVRRRRIGDTGRWEYQLVLSSTTGG
jgi:hypothetical protein